MGSSKAPRIVLERAVVAGRWLARGGVRQLLRVSHSRGAWVRLAASAWRGLMQRAAGRARDKGVAQPGE
jgi:hypothetical protein